MTLARSAVPGATGYNVYQGATTVIVSDPAAYSAPATHNFVLGPHARTAYLLPDSSKGYPETADIRGALEFSSATPGQLSVLGLRFNANLAFTSIPPLANAVVN